MVLLYACDTDETQRSDLRREALPQIFHDIAPQKHEHCIIDKPVKRGGSGAA